MIITGIQYFLNLISMVAKQQGYFAAVIAGFRFCLSEGAKLPIFLWINFSSKAHFNSDKSEVTWVTTLDEIKINGVEKIKYYVDINEFYTHMSVCDYPMNYAGGSINRRGWREQKALEYFVSIGLLDVQSDEIVIDIASEWSFFPEILQKLSGATVYRQDLIYPSGLNAYRIGGNATNLPIPNDFANKLVLHNSFEHFEGNTDTNFIHEAWRVLKPGGLLCILPLFLSCIHTNLTDPLVNRRGIKFDHNAQIIENLWFHNRFGRIYDPITLRLRVLIPGQNFNVRIYNIANLQEIHPKLYLHFALVMQKPKQKLEG